MTQVEIFIDGGARGNPGPAACGVALLRDGEVVLERGKYLGEATNNVAEYEGLLLGLELAAQLGANEVRINSDSELLVRQIEGRYRVKAAHLKPLYRKAKKMLDQFSAYFINHVPREMNKIADGLANRAMDEQGDV